MFLLNVVGFKWRQRLLVPERVFDVKREAGKCWLLGPPDSWNFSFFFHFWGLDLLTQCDRNKSFMFQKQKRVNVDVTCVLRVRLTTQNNFTQPCLKKKTPFKGLPFYRLRTKLYQRGFVVQKFLHTKVLPRNAQSLSRTHHSWLNWHIKLLK